MSESNGTAVQNRISSTEDVQTAKALKVAIVGRAPSSQKDAPFTDESYEIWTLNTAAQLNEIPRWDRQFEIHDVARIVKHSQEGYPEWLAEVAKEKPVYVQQAIKDTLVPDGIAYPIEEVVARFGNYFNNSISYMIALAILEDAQEISLYGVDMAQYDIGLKSEYAHQRPSCEYILGIAAGMGIKVHVADKCDLLKCRSLYGFEDNTAYAQKAQARIKELEGREMAARQKAEQGALEAAYLQGAKEDSQYWAQR